MTDQTRRPAVLALVALGAIAGLLSGVFGVGGGVVLVPMLALLLRYSQRVAAGTSVAAILPTAIVGGATYGLAGNVDWAAAAALAVGVIVGAQIGSRLLARIPTGALRWIFMGFLAVVAVSLWFVVPHRDAQVELSALTAVLLALTGVLVGVLSGLLGVGGGVIIVPVLMFFFGANDLVAKGTSLVVLIPGSISGTLGNIRRENVDLRAALILGLAASALSPVGAIVAERLSPFWANALFSALLAAVLVQMLVSQLRRR